MKFREYLKERFSNKLVKTAFISEKSHRGRLNSGKPVLEWKLIVHQGDERVNLNKLETVAWKELRKLVNNDLMDYMQNEYDVSSGGGSYGGPDEFEVAVKIDKIKDRDKLLKELKRMKFKIK